MSGQSQHPRPALHNEGLVAGNRTSGGELFESQARLMLWGVERAITGFAKIGADTDVQHKLHVILPGSPNRGVFGGDGAYGEVKSAFDAIVNRARAEKVWSSRVTLFSNSKVLPSVVSSGSKFIITQADRK